MNFNDRPVTAADLKKTIDLAEKMVRPILTEALLEGKPRDQMHDEICQLIMALGFGAAVVAGTCFPTMSAKEFARHFTTYIEATIPKIREKGFTTDVATAKESSAWDA